MRGGLVESVRYLTGLVGVLRKLDCIDWSVTKP